MKTRQIDAHMHFTPAAYLAELADRSLLAFPLAGRPSR
jgi:hypothetical protein